MKSEGMWLDGIEGPGQPNVIRAERFELIDQEGEVRAALAISSDGSPCLELRDKEGKVRVELTLTPDGSSCLRFRDKEGKVIWSAP